jgi:hypothetical protein
MKRSIFFKNQDRKNSACRILLFAFLFFLSFNGQALATMSSSNYKIPTDSINIGGQSSGSASYNELDTIGELGSGLSSSTNYKISAGFLAAQSVYLSITSASDISMSSFSGLTGGTGDGSTVWTVTTDNPAGYSLTIAASTNPALTSAGSQFDNYTPATSDPDFTWTVPSSAGEFGFTPEGVDIYSRFMDNGSSCNTGSGDTADKCWDSATTTPKMIAYRTTGNHPSGTTTTVKVRAESGTSHIQPDGAYSATLQVTLLPN